MAYACKQCGEDCGSLKRLNEHRWATHREDRLEKLAQAREKSPNYVERKGEPGEGVGEVPQNGKTKVIPVSTPKVPSGITASVSETALIRMVSQSQVVVMTPDIYMSYMCALKRGFASTLTQFLSIVAKDFWTGRGVDPYREVSGIGDEGPGLAELAGSQEGRG